ncbi:MAG: DNA recombination protein RmuC [Acidimicrobiaceae bacterium]|nr:DNA recombination protein RmuC [Acidimicrobiaceae bacterium]
MTTVWIVITASTATAVVGFIVGIVVAWGPIRRQQNATEATAQRMEATSSSFKDQAESINNRLNDFQRTVADLRSDTADQSGRIDTELQRVAREAGKLNAILANPNARGDWGERLAEDVLHAAGFQENVNYFQKMKQPGGEEPDFTFRMPNELWLHMDVKLPITNYQKVIEASVATYVCSQTRGQATF